MPRTEVDLPETVEHLSILDEEGTLDEDLLPDAGYNEGGGIPDGIEDLPVGAPEGAVARDLALTVHPHPTLSETIQEAAEEALERATHV